MGQIKKMLHEISDRLGFDGEINEVVLAEGRKIMGRARRWSGVRGETRFELMAGDAGGAIAGDIELPCIDCPKDGVYELLIEWESSGYDDPGSWGTCPDNSRPPEYEDERTLRAAYIVEIVEQEKGKWRDGRRTKLGNDVAQEVFEILRSEIDKQQLPEWEE